MSNPSEIYIDPGSTDAIPVYLVVASGVNTYLPRAALNDSSGNEITAGNPLAVYASVITVAQSGAPWLVNASVVGNLSVSATVATISVGAHNVTAYQGGAPWLVNASVVGQQTITASIVGSPTVYQGTAPWTVLGTVTIGAGAGVVAVTNVTLAALATVWQGGAPWLVNASIIGTPSVNANVQGTVPVSGSFWQTTQPVVASVVGTLVVGLMPAISVAQTTSSIGGGFIAPQADAGAVGTSIKYASALTNTIVTIKGTGTANLYGYHIYNPNTSVEYVSLFAATNATIGFTAATAQLVAPAGGWIDSAYDVPIGFTSGLMLGASASTNGAGAPTTGLIANFWYK